MKCSGCNYENVPGARFCERCGERLAPERAEQQAVLGAEAVAERPEAKKAPVNAAGSGRGLKNARGKAGVFLFLQLFLYLAIAAATILFIFFDKGVRVQSSFSTDTFGELSLFSVMVNLITGGDKYNPTAVSIIMGVGVVILAFCIALFWGVVFFTKIIKKFHKESHVMTLIITALNLAAVCLLVPLAYRFSGILTQICAREVNFMAAEISSISSIWSYVFAGCVVLMIAAELIFASKEKKLRKEDKKVMK